MNKRIIATAIISSSLFFASTAAFSSDRNNSTDLIYGTDVTVASPSEPFLGRPAMTNNQATDLIYGNFQPSPSASESPDLFADNDNNSTDLIYGS